MTGLCTAGYYCPNGSVSAEDIDCPVGHYCPLGSSTPQPCQNGTFSDNIRLTAQVSAVGDFWVVQFFIRLAFVYLPFVSNKKACSKSSHSGNIFLE